MKYNWPALKIKFFSSSFAEVKGFFEEQFGTYNGQIRTQTAGWTKEKGEWKRKIATKALKQLQTQRAQELCKNLDLVLVEINRRLTNYEYIEKVRMSDLKEIWEILRTENALPIRINHDGNVKTDQKDENFKQQIHEKMLNGMAEFVRQAGASQEVVSNFISLLSEKQ